MLPFVGIADGERKLVLSPAVPDPDSYFGIYDRLIGPFRTVRGAHWSINYGSLHPNVKTISQAEEMARRLERTQRRAR